ncbi:MAG: homocysteine S-methyltransferase family protein [Acidimicrobiales bacterium]
MASVVILDGGMGKELRRIGAPFRQPEWSALALMEAPEMVARAHQNFVDAGADVIITNNYAVVPYHLGDQPFAARGRELAARAGQLARQVADSAEHEVRVAGSLPPLFGSYEPTQFDPRRAAPIYGDIVDALDPYVDLWIGETFSRVDELTTTVAAIHERGSGQPIWMSFTLPDTYPADRVTLRSGETTDDIAAAVAASHPPVQAVLFNCSLPEQTGPAIRALARSLHQQGLDTALGGYANAFPVSRSGTYQANEVVFERRAELTADRYAEHVAEWIDDGATIVGGCCDMYPEHIAALGRFR